MQAQQCREEGMRLVKHAGTAVVKETVVVVVAVLVVVVVVGENLREQQMDARM